MQILARSTAPHVTTFTDRQTGASCELFHDPALGSFYCVRRDASDRTGPCFTGRAAAIDAVERELRALPLIATVLA